jgi:hypothetical protein
VKTLAAIRTHKWGEDEERLFASLSPVFGADLAVVFHDRDPDLKLPLSVADINADWVRAHDLRPVAQWGWRCGDYFYYRLREAFPEYDHYWMIEPDVFFTSTPHGFFDAFSGVGDDVLGIRPEKRKADVAFGAAIQTTERHRAIFALTRLSGRVLDTLADLRRAYCIDAPGSWRFANDETFVFSHAMDRDDITVADIVRHAPNWFDGAEFVTDPDILFDAVSGPWLVPGKVYHPVRGRASFKAALCNRIVSRNNWLSKIKASVDELTDADIEEISGEVAAGIQARLHAVRSDMRLARQLSRRRAASKPHEVETVQGAEA